jgi:hypothetical protein
MNFHVKALLAFLAFHVIVTGGGLMFDQVPQALGQGANANDTQLVGAVLYAFDGCARHGLFELSESISCGHVTGKWHWLLGGRTD